MAMTLPLQMLSLDGHAWLHLCLTGSRPKPHISISIWAALRGPPGAPGELLLHPCNVLDT